MKRHLICAVLIALVLCSFGFGQALSGTVVGTVTDPTGAAVPGANVRVVNEDTGLARSTLTNSDGQFRADTFPTGNISITVEHEGFDKLLRSGMRLTAADTIAVSLQLTVGNVMQTMQVTGEAALVQSQNAAVSTIITNQQIVETPLNGRTFTQMLQLSAGASPSTPGMTAGIASYGMRASTAVSINGATSQNNSYIVDGILNVAAWINNLVMVPPLEAVQEQRIMGSNYSAEYGSAAGAVTVVQTKSGTNSFHGAAYEFLRNDKLDANNFFSNRAGRPKPPYRRNQFGANVGGPVFKGKTFFFMDYEGGRIRQPSTTTTTIPTIAQRQMVTTGDFSGLGQTIYDPNEVVNGLRTAFPANLIPKERLDPAAAKLISFLPNPTSPGASNNFTFNPPGAQRADQFDVRLDQNVGQADRLFFKFGYENTTGSGPGTLPAAPSAIPIVGPYIALGSGFAGNSQMNNWVAILNYVRVLSPTAVNEFRAGAVRTHLDNLLWDNNLSAAQSVGIPNINVTDLNMGLPAITLPGFVGAGASTSSTSAPLFGSTSSYPELAHTITYQYQDIVSLTKGSHTLKFGAQFMRDQFDGHTSNSPRGVWDFNGQFTRQIGSSTAATALSDFALGAFDGSQRSIQYGIFGGRRWRVAGFAEDSFRVNNRLTLTYGLRYELQGPYSDVNGRWSNLNVSTGRAILPSSNSCGSSTICLDKNNFAPRLGIAYVLTGDGKTVLRMGSGFSYFAADNGGKMMHQNPPMSIIQQFTTNATGAPTMLLSQGLPLPTQPDLNSPAQLTQLFYAWDPNLVLAKSMQWSIGIQREIFSDLLADVSYVGSRTLDMLNIVNANQAAPGPGALGPRRPLYSTNPSIGDLPFRTNYGASKYHSLQVNLVKRYGHGLTGTLAFTWSHNMANTLGPNANAIPQNSNCYRCEWGNVPEDRHRMLVINHVYQLPFGTGRKFASRGFFSYVVGNWDLSGLWTMYSGLHFTPGISTSVSGSIGAPLVSPVERPNLNGTPNLPVDERNIARWFNVPAFSIPSSYTFGNSGWGILEGPGLFTADLGIHRTFAIREATKLTFRWEMFNSLNRANFNNPNATIGGSAAGTISATYPARSMQLGLKLLF
jgi:hypothetical protein